MESQNPYQSSPVSLGVQQSSTNFGLGADGQHPSNIPPNRDTPDPGSPFARKIALVLVILLVAGVTLMQQLSGSGAPASKEPVEVKAPVGFCFFEGQVYGYVKYWGFIESLVPAQGSGGQTPAYVGNLDEGKKMMAQGIQDMPGGAVEEFRAALAIAYVGDHEKAREELIAIQTSIATQASSDPTASAAHPGLKNDVNLAIGVIDNGVDSLSSDDRTLLVDRHGYFAKLLFAAHQPIGSSERSALTVGAGKMIGLLLVFIVFLFLVGVASFVCFIIAVIRLGDGRIKPKFKAPMPGGSIFLESLAVFAAGFLALKVGMDLLTGGAGGPAGTGAPSMIAGIVAMVLQWSLLFTVFWPRLRGVSMAELSRRIGWTKGEGVMKEVGAGMFAYFASLPIFLLVILVMVGVIFWHAAGGGTGGGSPVETPENPVFDAINSGNPLMLGMLFLLATLWAPFVEESLFRGGLFRHLRSRMGVLLAALISTIAFGVMHNYPWMLLAPVMTLGFNFALMREWRGSLIAPMFAHAMHNGTVLLIAYLAINTLSVPKVT